MKTTPDKYFDLCVVDPPYGIGYDSATKKVAGTQFGNAAAKKRMYHTSDWDKQIPKQEYFAELFRVSKKQIIWGGNYMTKYLPPSKCFICWDKKQMKSFLTILQIAKLRGEVMILALRVFLDIYGVVCFREIWEIKKSEYTLLKSQLHCTDGFIRIMQRKATKSLTRI